MLKAALVFAFVLLTISLVNCKNTKDVKIKEIKTTTAAIASQEDQDIRSDVDLISIMNDCNETFRIEMSYLEQLNESGSFPDETDRTPKCYIRCVLETSGVASEGGEFDPRKAADVLVKVNGGFDSNTIEEMATTCIERKETCKCERSYQFIKCLMEKEIEKYENPE